MGQAFDRDGHVLGEAFGDTKREVFDKLAEQFKDAHEIRIRSLLQQQAVGVATAGTVSTEMPRYRCHKEVWALKIKAVIHNSVLAQLSGKDADGSALIVPADEGYAEFRVDAAYVRKHDPQPGGYYVVYADGYKSFSPAQAFESGYVRLIRDATAGASETGSSFATK